MTAAANVQLVVLFEDEIRKASKMLDQVFNLPEGIAPEELSVCVQDALRACQVALYHEQLLKEGSIVMLTGSRKTFGA